MGRKKNKMPTYAPSEKEFEQKGISGKPPGQFLESYAGGLQIYQDKETGKFFVYLPVKNKYVEVPSSKKAEFERFAREKEREKIERYKKQIESHIKDVVDNPKEVTKKIEEELKKQGLDKDTEVWKRISVSFGHRAGRTRRKIEKAKKEIEETYKKLERDVAEGKITVEEANKILEKKIKEKEKEINKEIKKIFEDVSKDISKISPILTERKLISLKRRREYIYKKVFDEDIKKMLGFDITKVKNVKITYEGKNITVKDGVLYVPIDKVDELRDRLRVAQREIFARLKEIKAKPESYALVNAQIRKIQTLLGGTSFAESAEYKIFKKDKLAYSLLQLGKIKTGVKPIDKFFDTIYKFTVATEMKKGKKQIEEFVFKGAQSAIAGLVGMPIGFAYMIKDTTEEVTDAITKGDIARATLAPIYVPLKQTYESFRLLGSQLYGYAKTGRYASLAGTLTGLGVSSLIIGSLLSRSPKVIREIVSYPEGTVFTVLGKITKEMIRRLYKLREWARKIRYSKAYKQFSKSYQKFIDDLANAKTIEDFERIARRIKRKVTKYDIYSEIRKYKFEDLVPDPKRKLELLSKVRNELYKLRERKLISNKQYRKMTDTIRRMMKAVADKNLEKLLKEEINLAKDFVRMGKRGKVLRVLLEDAKVKPEELKTALFNPLTRTRTLTIPKGRTKLPIGKTLEEEVTKMYRKPFKPSFRDILIEEVENLLRKYGKPRGKVYKDFIIDGLSKIPNKLIPYVKSFEFSSIAIKNLANFGTKNLNLFLQNPKIQVKFGIKPIKISANARKQILKQFRIRLEKELQKSVSKIDKKVVSEVATLYTLTTKTIPDEAKIYKTIEEFIKENPPKGGKFGLDRDKFRIRVGRKTLRITKRGLKTYMPSLYALWYGIYKKVSVKEMIKLLKKVWKGIEFRPIVI